MQITYQLKKIQKYSGSSKRALHDTTVNFINNIVLKENYEFVSLTRAKK